MRKFIKFDESPTGILCTECPYDETKYVGSSNCRKCIFRESCATVSENTISCMYPTVESIKEKIN